MIRFLAACVLILAVGVGLVAGVNAVAPPAASCPCCPCAACPCGCGACDCSVCERGACTP